jgi:uncharacterized membrane protein
MTAPNADRIISAYLARLGAALASVPAPRRQELTEELRAHIAEARSRLQTESDSDLLNILDRLGDPAEMAAAEIDPVESTPPRPARSRALEIAAIVLLLLFWPVGVVLLWMSDAWTTRQKLIGTLVPPGGYIGVLVLGPLLAWGTVAVACSTVTDGSGRVLSSTCPPDAAQTAITVGATVLAIVYLVLPLVTAAYLATRLRRADAAPGAGDAPLVPRAAVKA